MSITTNQQEAGMSQTVPTMHPAVVLRSHYRNLKSLLAIALIAIVSLSVTVVMLARDEERAVDSVPTVAKPDESKIAAAVSARQLHEQQTTSRPDESRIAAAVGGPQETRPQTGGPDESKVAAAVGGGQPDTGPDESRIAAALGSGL
jgi:hypothetical protein